MHTFTDNAGDEWAITLDTTSLREIRKELGLDLLLNDETVLQKLLADDETLVDLISFICTEQIERKEMTARDFARVLVGDAIDAACDALVQELVFISRRQRKTILQAAWDKIKTIEAQQTETAIQYLDSGIIEKEMEKAFQKATEQPGT